MFKKDCMCPMNQMPNYQEAMNLYKKASDLGNMEARKELNTIYNKLNRFM